MIKSQEKLYFIMKSFHLNSSLSDLVSYSQLKLVLISLKALFTNIITVLNNLIIKSRRKFHCVKCCH